MLLPWLGSYSGMSSISFCFTDARYIPKRSQVIKNKRRAKRLRKAGRK